MTEDYGSIERKQRKLRPGPRIRSAASSSRRRYLPFLLGAIVIISAIASAVVLTHQKDTIKVGVILPETVPFSHTPEIRQAMSIAVEKINQWGGIGTTHLELVFEETSSEPDAIASVFDKIERKHRPLFYVTSSCEFMFALAPLAEGHSVPLIGIASATNLTVGYSWAFRYYTHIPNEVSAAMDILEGLHVNSLGIMYAENPHGCEINGLLSQEFLKTGGTVQSETCGLDETEFLDMASNLSGNQAIYVVGPCGILVNMLDGVLQSNYDGYVLTASCGSTPLMWGLPQLDGVYTSAPLLYKPENIPSLSFMTEFTETYGIPPTHHAAAAHDILNLVHDLLEGHEASRDNLRQQLDEGFVFSGVHGILRIQPGVHDFVFPVYPAVVSEGELRYL